MGTLQTFAFFCVAIMAISVFCSMVIGATAAVIYLRTRRAPTPARRYDGLAALDPDVIFLDVERLERRPKGAA
jgi:predicted anti-sigma-YlaC factor YlaD